MAELDADYRDRIQEAVMSAIVKESIDPVSKVTMMRNGEITSALVMVLAMFASTSEETSSPNKTREVADRLAKTFRRRVQEFKDAGPLPFDVINPDNVN